VAVASAGPYASLHLAPDKKPHQHPTTLFFTGRMPFLPPNQQRQSTEDEGKTQQCSIITRSRLRDWEDIPDEYLLPSPSDKLASEDEEGTRRGDNVPLGARSGASRDLRLRHGSLRLFHAGSDDDPRSVRRFSRPSDDTDVNFLAANILWPRRLLGVPSDSLVDGSACGLEVVDLTFEDNDARSDFLAMIRFSLLPEVDAVWSPDTEFD